MTWSTDPFAAAILIVDDQQSNVRLLEFVLRRAGYSAVSSTMEPRTVCALHQQNRYDLILLDLQMPGLNGFQVMEDLAATGLESVVLVLSADPRQMVPALQAGGDDFLSKPFDLQDVLLRVARLLEKTRAGEISAPIPPLATAPTPELVH